MNAPAADRRDRDAARLRLDANVVVEAGAGTGKTTLLTDRLIFLLLGRERPLPVTALVALTFTEKAAGEIMLRLAERLAELTTRLSGGALPEKARERAEATLRELRTVFHKTEASVLSDARNALEQLDKAQIGTIHSFASHLLRLYPVEAGVDPGFRVDQGEDFDELFASEWARWLDVELGEDPPRRAAWLEVLRETDLDDLETLARELCRERVDLLGVGGADAESAVWLESLSADLKRAVKDQPEPGRASRIQGAVAALQTRLSALAAAARVEMPTMPAEPAPALIDSSWPKRWDEAGRPAYERASAAAAAASVESEALVRRACALLLPFARAFRAAYTRRGLVSFDGLLLKARDLVRDQPAVREELKRKYAALLIDEFQDTDPLQGELLLFLAEAEGGRARRWQDVRLGAGRLFVVGDPKQSIYRFRGADISAYQRFVELVLEGKDAIACDLKTNFRSHAGVIDPVNAVFAKAMVYREGSQPAYKAIAPHDAKGRQAPAVELVVVGPAEGEEKSPDAATTSRTEAAWVADWVSAHAGEGRQWGFKDVAVLMRTSGALASLLEALRARGIPYVVEMEKSFYGAQEVIDFLNLLRVLDDPGDRLSFAGLLRSPLGGLADRDLYRLARAKALSYLKDPPAGLPKSERDRLSRLYESLRSLRSRVGRVPLGELVWAALGETTLLETAARSYHGQQTVSNLLKFGRMASAAADERGMTLNEFTLRVASAMGESRQEGESPLADEHLEAVRILSIHKSKGLEFPVVFVTGLSNKPGGGGEKPAALLDWASGRAGLRLPRAGAANATMARLEQREKERQADEAVRLLYVALTRAKDKLILLGRDSGDKNALSSRLKDAGAWPEGDGGELRLEGLKAPIPVRRRRAGEGVLPGGGAAAPGLKPDFALPDTASLAKTWFARLARREEAETKPWTMSPTDYLKEPMKRKVLDEDVASRAPSGARVGEICHKILEAWDFRQGGDLDEAVGAAERALARAEPGADWPAAAVEAKSLLKTFLASPVACELGSVEILGREVPFAYAEGGAVMRGSIDLLYKKGGKVVVADYKTDRVTGKELAARREKYRLQGAAYSKAVEKALGIAGVAFRLIFLRKPELSE